MRRTLCYREWGYVSLQCFLSLSDNFTHRRVYKDSWNLSVLSYPTSKGDFKLQVTLSDKCTTSWPVVLHLYSSAVTLVLVSERRTWQTSSRSLPSEYPSIKQLDSVGETTETPRNRLSALRIDPGSARLFKRAPNQQSGLLLIWWVHIAQRNSQYVS